MTPPNTPKQLCVFIVLVNCYRNMWSKHSHLLHPLTLLTSNNVKFKCTDIEKKAFDKIKFIVSCDTLSAYPDFNKKIDIHIYASDYHLGEVTSQDGKPIAY